MAQSHPHEIERRGHGWPARLEVTERFTIAPRAEISPSLQLDAVADEPHGTIAQDEVHPAGMPASRTLDGSIPRVAIIQRSIW